MQLSNQAIGAIMMALQESLMHQTDIVPVLKHWKLQTSDNGLIVTNPPTVRVSAEFGQCLSDGTEPEYKDQKPPFEGTSD